MHENFRKITKLVKSFSSTCLKFKCNNYCTSCDLQGFWMFSSTLKTSKFNYLYHNIHIWTWEDEDNEL